MAQVLVSAAVVRPAPMAAESHLAPGASDAGQDAGQDEAAGDEADLALEVPAGAGRG